MRDYPEDSACGREGERRFVLLACAPGRVPAPTEPLSVATRDIAIVSTNQIQGWANSSESTMPFRPPRGEELGAFGCGARCRGCDRAR